MSHFGSVRPFSAPLSIHIFTLFYSVRSAVAHLVHSYSGMMVKW